MKLVSFVHDGRPAFGAVKEGGVVNLAPHFAGQGILTLRGLLAAGALDAARGIVAGAAPDLALDGAIFLPVIPDPDKIICIGLNYRDHVAETGRTVTEHPALFGRFAGSQVGHMQAMVKPRCSDELDFEGELAVVIGTAGRHIPAHRALAHVAGYSCYNEGSVRDWQRHTSQFLAGKTFAGTGAFGPWLVTADEVPDPAGLAIETRLNGAVVQRGDTGQMITGVPGLIAYCSAILPLLPGDVIVTGTPSGVGARRTPPLWLRAGDTVEVEIEGIGCLCNPVVNEDAVEGLQAARMLTTA
jgi:2-keto-4-pentenoate hydratase/2-oxohepta-3-ene-1,7-dioic acid hydratase in catechol pathway